MNIQEIEKAQEKWGNGVVKIGALKDIRTECETFASAFLDARYAFDAAEVLFKPTKCEVEQFRPSKDDHAYIRVDEIDTKDEILLHHVDSKSTTE